MFKIFFKIKISFIKKLKKKETLIQCNNLLIITWDHNEEFLFKEEIILCPDMIIIKNY